MKNTKRYTEKQLREAVKSSTHIRQVLQKLGLKQAGGNYKTVNLKIKLLALDTSHMKGSAWNKGMKFPNRGKSLKKIMIKNSTYTNTSKLRQRILSENLLLRKCNSCNKKTWQGQKIPLELHHKNGNHFDHRLNNIELLCPNCHAQTDTYRGRNV